MKEIAAWLAVLIGGLAVPVGCSLAAAALGAGMADDPGAALLPAVCIGGGLLLLWLGGGLLYSDLAASPRREEFRRM